MRAIFSLFLGFSIVSPSVAENHISTADVLPIEWNFEASSAPAMTGPMCVAKPRPLSCGADCWRVLLNENSEPSTNEQEFAVLLPAVPFVLPALGRSEAADALDRTALTEASFRKLLERLAHNQD